MSQPLNSQSASGAGAVTWPPDLSEDRALAGATVGGNYQLVERIGIGGMGVVYRAQQVHPVKRVVAIKLIKLGIDSPNVVARFEAERQALATLAHPGICRVYDAGATDTGRPFFVMEHVAGRPINEYCDHKRLNTHARIELFRQACAAVQHAHYNGILHRDLKPSNMLVCETDGAAQVKIIDFGIAKAMQTQPAEPSPLVTQAGQFVGTPAYTSPEQARGDDVDTRADIFSLGVVLYELLSGALPFDLTRPATDRTDPPKPSARLSTIGLPAATKFAELRGADATSLRKQLRGDLDQIVLKAMHPDRTQRYDSAAALAEDIRRYLAHEPILARPPTLAYEARKFARRNRVLVGAVAMVIVAMVIGGTAATIGLFRARQALAREAKALRDEQSQRLVAQNISGFLGDMLSSVDPHKAQGNQVLVRDVLEQASKDLPMRFAKQPLVAASLHQIIGQTYASLGQDETALTHLQAAIDHRQAELGPDHPDTLDAQRAWATTAEDLGRSKDAEAVFRGLVEKHRRIHGLDHSETLKAEDGLALVLQHLNRAAEAEPLQRHVLETYRRKHGDEHPATLHAMHNMSPILAQLGKSEEAEKLDRFVAETRVRVLGEDDPSTLLSRSNHASALMQLKRFEEAVPILRDVVERQTRVSGAEHPDTLSALNNLAMALELSGKHDDAIVMMKELLQRVRRALPPGHPHMMLTLANLAQTLEERKRIDESLEYYKEIFDTAPKSAMPPQFIAEYMAEYAFKLVQHDKLDQAEGPLLAAKKQFEVANLGTRPKMQRLIKGLIEVCEKSGRADEAQAYRDELARVVAAAATMPATQPGRR